MCTYVHIYAPQHPIPIDPKDQFLWHKKELCNLGCITPLLYIHDFCAPYIVAFDSTATSELTFLINP